MTPQMAGERLPPSVSGQRTGHARKTRSQHATPQETRRPANVDQVLDESFPASDPPSWTGAISRVAASPRRHHIDERVARRLRAEFLEMPGLCLTTAQVQRLCGLDARTCEALLGSFVDSGFLRRTDRGLFVLCVPGRSDHPAGR
jgi:hypothetical protein